jgi:hypothetical protein
MDRWAPPDCPFTARRQGAGRLRFAAPSAGADARFPLTTSRRAWSNRARLENESQNHSQPESQGTVAPAPPLNLSKELFSP